MAKYFFFFLVSFILNLGFNSSARAQTLIQKADSLFAAQRFSDSRELYRRSFFEQKKTTPATLLKLAFIEESMDNYVMSIFYLHQYYLFNPGKKIKSKIEEMANQKKFYGYSIDEADYAFFLYRSYASYVEGGLLILATFMFLFLLNRKRKKISLGYSPVFTLLFLLAAAYFYNFQLPYRRAILVEDNAFLMSGPSSGSSVVDVLIKGHRLEWIGQNDIWYEVKWNEKKGWLKKSDLLFFM